MSDNTNNSSKRKPDYIAYSVKSISGEGPDYTRIGVGFTHKNGGIGIMYDSIPHNNQIVLIGYSDEKPGEISYGRPVRKPSFEACLVRESGDNSFWNTIGSAWRQEGYTSIHLDVVPLSGKIVLSIPKERE